MKQFNLMSRWGEDWTIVRDVGRMLGGGEDVGGRMMMVREDCRIFSTSDFSKHFHCRPREAGGGGIVRREV